MRPQGACTFVMVIGLELHIGAIHPCGGARTLLSSSCRLLLLCPTHTPIALLRMRLDTDHLWPHQYVPLLACCAYGPDIVHLACFCPFVHLDPPARRGPRELARSPPHCPTAEDFVQICFRSAFGDLQ